MKFLNTHLNGKFVTEKGIEYRVEVKSQSSKEIINFYKSSGIGNGENLVCSVFTKFLSKADGVKKAGDILREVYGDFSVYSDFDNLRTYAKNYEKSKLEDVSNRKLVDSRLGKFVEVLEKRNAYFFNKVTYSDGNLLEEVIQEFSVPDLSVDTSSNLDDQLSSGMLKFEIRLELFEEGKKVRVDKIKGRDYKIRDGETRENNSHIVIQSLDYIALKKDISWMKEREYRILNDKDEFLAYLTELENCDNIVGFDTETSGLKINRFEKSHPQRDNLVGICISVRNGEGVYIPIRQTKFENLDESFVIESLRPYFSNSRDENNKVVRAKCNLVTHYGSFDWKVMFTYGWDLNITDDTYILQYLIDVREANAVKKLKIMSERILGLQMIDLEDFFPSNRGGKKSNIRFSLLPYESVRHYGPVDSDVTRLLYFELRPKLPEEMKFIYAVEIELMKRLGRIEYYGIRIDIGKMLEQRDIVFLEKEKLEGEIYKLAGEKFNINSGDQLERILFDKLKYPSHGHTAGGKRATGKLVLEILSNDKSKDGKYLYPLAVKILEYKKKEKLLNSFLDKLLRENIDGFIFPKYNQAGTQSGRISCSNPNLQQTSGAIRELFIPDSDDYYFLVVDYSQVEYRIMAGLADEYEVIDFFKSNPEADYHIMMYARMSGKPYEQVTSKERKQGKTLNFGISYGMSPPSLALKLYGSNTEEQVKDAEQKIIDYFDSVANIRDYQTVIKDGAQLRGYVKTLFKRRRHISEFLKENPKYYEIERGKRKAGNTVVQGTAADIMKYAHVRVEKYLEEGQYDARPVASIHDELVILVNKKHNPWELISVVRKAMELDLSNQNFPPLYIGANVGYSWADGKKDSLECPVLLMNRRMEEFNNGLHKEGLLNPKESIERELKTFAIEIISEELHANNISNIEKAYGVPRLMKYINNYIGESEGEKVIKGVLSGLSVDEILERIDHVEIYGEDYFDDIYEDIDDSLEPSTDSDDEEAIIDYGKLQNYYEENKEKLKLEPTILKQAKEVYNERYSVLAFDRKINIRVDDVSEGLVKDLVSYFESVNVEKGYDVIFHLGGKMTPTSFKCVSIDRLKIIDIIESHVLKKDKKKLINS